MPSGADDVFFQMKNPRLFGDRRSVQNISAVVSFLIPLLLTRPALARSSRPIFVSVDIMPVGIRPGPKFIRHRPPELITTRAPSFPSTPFSCGFGLRSRPFFRLKKLGKMP